MMATSANMELFWGIVQIFTYEIVEKRGKWGTFACKSLVLKEFVFCTFFVKILIENGLEYVVNRVDVPLFRTYPSLPSTWPTQVTFFLFYFVQNSTKDSSCGKIHRNALIKYVWAKKNFYFLWKNLSIFVKLTSLYKIVD